jgi:hypothetical protein
MMAQFPPTWQRYFAQPAAAASTPPPSVLPRRLYGGYTAGSPVFSEAGAASSGAAPPAPPRPPVDHRPMPPEPPCRPLEFAWLTWQMPPGIQEQAKEALRLTLDWRAKYCKPLDAPEEPPDYTRFGLKGEQLVPKGGITMRKMTRAELRETIRTVEGSQSRTERNRLLAMHSIRLGQLCAELEQRGIDALEEVRNGLAYLWA